MSQVLCNDPATVVVPIMYHTVQLSPPTHLIVPVGVLIIVGP